MDAVFIDVGGHAVAEEARLSPVASLPYSASGSTV